MFAKDDSFYHMVVLILTCSSNIVGIGNAYIVRDSREDVIDSSRSLYFGKSPTFPDYFGKSEENDFSISDDFGSSERSLGLTNPARNMRPRPSLNSQDTNGTKNWKKTGSPHGSNGREDSVPGKRPILNLYDDWSPGEEYRFRKPSGQPGFFKYREGGESDVKPSNRYALPKPNRPGPPYKPIFSSTPEKFFKTTPTDFQSHRDHSATTYKNSADQTSLSQYYKNLHSPTPTFSAFYDTSPQKFNQDSHVHQHKYGINHDYTPRGHGDEVSSSFRAVSSKSPPQNIDTKPKNTFYDGSDSWKSFRPSSPDVFLNKYSNFHNYKSDFLSPAGNNNNKKIKRSLNQTSCIKKTKRFQVGKNPVKWITCSTCVDETGTIYEKCSDSTEKYSQEKIDKQSRFRGKRSVPDIGNHRYEHDHDDYRYGPDHHEYRFGPEHFTDDDAPIENNRELNTDNPHDAEACWKKKKGEMLCIMCENRANGGTYEQCSYGSDPKKNSYERSVSKVYGTPRLPNADKYSEEETKHPIPNRPPNTQDWHDTKSGYRSDNGNGHVGSNSRYNNGIYSKMPERDNKSYRNGYKHVDVNRPNIYVRPVAYHSPEYSKAHSISGSYKPGEPGETTFKDHEEPLRHHLREYRQSSFNNKDPFEDGYADSSQEVFHKSDTIPFGPHSDYAGEYDEYDDYTSGDVEDGQGQFSANLQKHIGNPSPEHDERSRGSDFIEKAIGEFSNKNRTSCTKVQKDKMTCYQCVDERGSQNEECIYVAGNKPKTKQLSFREVREFNYHPTNNQTNTTEQSTDHGPMGNQRYTMNRDKRKFKKYYPETGRSEPITHSVRQTRSSDDSTPSRVANIDSISSTEVKSENEADIQAEKKDNGSDSIVRSQSPYNPIPTDPPVFSQEVQYDMGHSDETEMDFDPVLGLSLPRYMLEKSEHEAIFDEALASG